jgi:hypothetical protein
MITVQNKARAKVQPYQFRIEERRNDNIPPARVTFPYNPEGWERSMSVNWRPRGAAGVEMDESDWQGNEPSSLSISNYILQMDDAELLEFGVLIPLEQWAQRVDSRTQEPPLMLLSFGIHTYSMALVRLSVNRTLTDARGHALKAEISMEFIENRKRPGNQ